MHPGFLIGGSKFRWTFIEPPASLKAQGTPREKLLKAGWTAFKKIVPPLPGCTISFPMASAPIFKVLLIIHQNNPGRDWADFPSAVHPADGTILPWRPPSLERSGRFYFHLFGQPPFLLNHPKQVTLCVREDVASVKLGARMVSTSEAGYTPSTLDSCCLSLTSALPSVANISFLSPPHLITRLNRHSW